MTIVFDHADKWDRNFQVQDAMLRQNQERQRLSLMKQQGQANQFNLEQAQVGVDQEMAERLHLRESLKRDHGFLDDDLVNIEQMPMDSLREYHGQVEYEGKLKSARDNIGAMVDLLYADESEAMAGADPNDPATQQVGQKIQSLKDGFMSSVVTLDDAGKVMDSLFKELADRETAVVRSQQRTMKAETARAQIQALNSIGGMSLNAVQSGKLEALIRMYDAGQFDPGNDAKAHEAGDKEFSRRFANIMLGQEDDNGLLTAYDRSAMTQLAQWTALGLDPKEVTEQLRQGRSAAMGLIGGAPAAQPAVAPPGMQGVRGMQQQQPAPAANRRAATKGYTPFDTNKPEDTSLLSTRAGRLVKFTDDQATLEAEADKLAESLVRSRAGIGKSDPLDETLIAEIERVTNMLAAYARSKNKSSAKPEPYLPDGMEPTNQD